MKPQFRARFRTITVLQVVLLTASVLAFAWSVLSTNHIAVPVVVGAIIAIQVAALIAYVQSHVKALEDFFAAVTFEDFTRRFVEEDTDAELREAFNRILDKFQIARAERDLQANYLETVVKHVPVPFIAVRADGSLSLVNKPARRLTGLPVLRKIDQLAELDPELPEKMQSIEAGKQRLLQTRIRDVPAELRVSVAEIVLSGEIERLYAIENLSGELAARESSAWRNLIRVLTHEIMNTLTPVSSLAQTTSTMIDDPDASDDVRDAVTTIARRSEGLINFVSQYRELLKVPQPQPEVIEVSDALNDVVRLMSGETDGIDMQVEVTPSTLQVSADRQLLDQVLVNLVRNAASAVQDLPSPRIQLLGELDFGRVVIRVKDNGAGIPAESLGQVFVPFFTTKRDGSGIGLSLSRQIMTAHNGDIVVESDAAGTRVSLLF